MIPEPTPDRRAGVPVHAAPADGGAEPDAPVPAPAGDRSAAVSSVATELGVLLMQIRTLRVEEAAAFHAGLQPGAFAVARWIRTDGPASAGAVAAGLLMDKSSVSRHLRVLREAGYVQDEPDPEDRRSTILPRTPLAEERLRRCGWARASACRTASTRGTPTRSSSSPACCTASTCRRATGPRTPDPAASAKPGRRRGSTARPPHPAWCTA